jgi:hypothetical protein
MAGATQWKYGVYALLGLGVTILVLIIIYDIFARFNGWQTIMIPGVAKFTNYREGLENQQCYGQPIDFASNQFVSTNEMYRLFMAPANEGKCPNPNDLPCIAKKLNVRQTLAEAQADCRSSGACTGIIHWNGTPLRPVPDAAIISVYIT